MEKVSKADWKKFQNDIQEDIKKLEAKLTEEQKLRAVFRAADRGYDWATVEEMSRPDALEIARYRHSLVYWSCLLQEQIAIEGKELFGREPASAHKALPFSVAPKAPPAIMGAEIPESWSLARLMARIVALEEEVEQLNKSLESVLDEFKELSESLGEVQNRLDACSSVEFGSIGLKGKATIKKSPKGHPLIAIDKLIDELDEVEKKTMDDALHPYFEKGPIL